MGDGGAGMNARRGNEGATQSRWAYQVEAVILEDARRAREDADGLADRLILLDKVLERLRHP
jgi:hypothetical protein